VLQVARYNTLQQNAQALNVNLSNSVLHRAKPEILRGVELLIDKMQNEMADLLIEVVIINVLNTVFTRVIFTLFWPIFLSKTDAKIMRGIFGRRFRGDFQVRSGIRYPIHKLQMKCFSVII
jgi:hypothetical protein